MPSNVKGVNRFSALAGTAQVQDAQADSSTCTPPASSESESGKGSTSTVEASSNAAENTTHHVPLTLLEQCDQGATSGTNQDVVMLPPSPTPAVQGAPAMQIPVLWPAAPLSTTSSVPSAPWSSSSTAPQSMSSGILSTPTSFTPPTAPSSYAGSAVSSIKPSSSISVRAERHGKKRKAEDDDSSMVSSGSQSATAASTTSSTQRRRLAPVPAALDRVGDQLSSLNDTFRASVALMGSAMSSAPSPTNRPLPQAGMTATNMSNTSGSSAAHISARKSEATEKLLLLEAESLAPSQIVLIMDYFQKNVSYADTYLVLAKDTPSHKAIREEWLKKRIEEAAELQ